MELAPTRQSQRKVLSGSLVLGDALRSVIPAAGRHYPLYKGCGRLGSIGSIVRLSEVDDPVRLARLRNGQRIWVRLDDYVGRALFYFGDFDRRLTWLIERILRPGDTVVDIGANYGWLSLWSAQLVGPTGQVHSFEPQPGILDLLRRSVAYNQADQVAVHPVALSDADGELDLWVPDGTLGSASLTRIGTSPGSSYRVVARQAGDYLSEVAPGPVRLVKIDVEGHEDFIFRGAAEWIASADVTVIVFEWNDQRPLEGSDTAVALQDLGYSFFQVEETPWRANIVPFRPDHPANDYVAVRPREGTVLAALGVAERAPS